jgi:hypothetical protein
LGLSETISETVLSLQECETFGQQRADVRDPMSRDRLQEWETVADLAMLICASVGSMAFGILAAYGILRAGFALMRPPARRVAIKRQPQVARVS